jgi:hypothetical protein
MVNPNRFYTYAYLREDRTPYYIGKGQTNRIYQKNGRPCGKPKDKSRIIFLKQNLTEEEAFKHEIYMIAVFGRKDLGTGILHNRTDGGEGSSGTVRSEETRIKISKSLKGKYSGKNNYHYGRRGINSPNYGKKHSEEQNRRHSEIMKGRFSGENNPNYGKSASEETRRKKSEVMKGKFKGENHPQYGKIGINSPNYGKKRSKETKRKQSEVKKGKNNPNYGKKWWNDGCGNSVSSVECPGEGWSSGRGEKIKNKMMKSGCKYLYEITSPLGEVFITNNLSDFCRKNPQYRLNRPFMCDVANGKKEHYKGWTVRKLAQGHSTDPINAL